MNGRNPKVFSDYGDWTECVDKCNWSPNKTAKLKEVDSFLLAKSFFEAPESQPNMLAAEEKAKPVLDYRAGLLGHEADAPLGLARTRARTESPFALGRARARAEPMFGGGYAATPFRSGEQLFGGSYGATPFRSRAEGPICYFCHTPGHVQTNCPELLRRF